MKVYRFLDDLPRFRNPVLTIGTFDGVHEGHQQIIGRINAMAREMDGESILLTFHPHPRLVLNPNDTSLQLINTLQEKIDLLDHYGIHEMIIATFSKAFAQTSPRDYIKHFLVDKIQPKVIVIGYDHHFGKDRGGNIETLRQYAGAFGYRVEEIEKHIVEDVGVSSTKIREAISAGQITQANHLLGHPFRLTGRVIKGHQIGNQLGYPTANLFVEDKHKIIPGVGIYASRVRVGEQWYKGMLYIGYRPTFSGKEKAIEVNLFDFNGNLYGDELTLDIVAEIRGDKRFDTPEELAAQMAADKEATLRILDQG